MSLYLMKTIAPPPTRRSLVRVAQALPAAPRILAQLGQLLGDLNSSTDDIVTLLKRDAALTARVLRVSNSVSYGADEPCASLEEALLRVGFSDVYRIAGFATAARLTGQYLRLYGMSAAQFRENALLTALAMEKLAPFGGQDPREAYTAGLLRSVGKIALDHLANEMPRPPGESDPSVPLTEWELAHVGISNVDAAVMILEEWNFPVATLQAIRGHYDTSETDWLTMLLHLAVCAAERCGHGCPGERTYFELTPEKLAEAHMDQDQFDAAMRSALEEFGPLRMTLA